MRNQWIKCYGVACALSLLAACGGGGGGAGVVQMMDAKPFAVTNGATPSSLSAVVLNSASRTTSSGTGIFNPEAGTFSVGALMGTINADGDLVVLDGGGIIEVLDGDTDHAAQFIATPTTTDRLIGIVGFETEASDLPSGVATYQGTTEITIVDGSDVYALSGTATIAADFDGMRVDTTLKVLDGTVTVGATAPADVADVATIMFVDSDIAGTGFTDGTASVTSSELSALSGSETSSLDGAFFGPGADESGAAFVIDDTVEGSLLIQGVALAD